MHAKIRHPATESANSITNQLTTEKENEVMIKTQFLVYAVYGVCFFFWIYAQKTDRNERNKTMLKMNAKKEERGDKSMLDIGTND